GTFVAGEMLRQSAANKTATPIVISKQWERLAQLANAPRRAVPFNFELGVPDLSHFPFPLWRSLLNSRARMLSTTGETYAQSQGHAPLREAIAKYTSFTRAVVCAANDVLVTNGAQQAFALIAYVLIRPGTVVAVEHPGYDRARRLFETHG